MPSSSNTPAKEADGESTTKPNWLELPTDVTANILNRLGVVQIVRSARRVCPLWRNICDDPLMWRTIDMSNQFALDFKVICRYVVDKSCGFLEDIKIHYFADDDLLEYIADRASHLRRIQLVKCCEISDEGLSEVAKKLPLLEELDIFSHNLSKETLETIGHCFPFFKSQRFKDSLVVIGQCCPFLKSLKFNKNFNQGVCDDDEAFAIARTMPRIRQLQIIGNQLTNDGLLAILDGCAHLESLDLLACFNLDLRGSLGKRCIEQIKDLRLPNDYLNGNFTNDDYCHFYWDDYLSGYSGYDDFSALQGICPIATAFYTDDI